VGAQGSRPARAQGDHPAKRASKAASEPAETGSPFAVPPLKFIIISYYIYFFSYIIIVDIIIILKDFLNLSLF